MAPLVAGHPAPLWVQVATKLKAMAENPEEPGQKWENFQLSGGVERLGLSFPLSSPVQTSAELLRGEDVAPWVNCERTSSSQQACGDVFVMRPPAPLCTCLGTPHPSSTPRSVLRFSWSRSKAASRYAVMHICARSARRPGRFLSSTVAPCIGCLSGTLGHGLFA